MAKCAAWSEKKNRPCKGTRVQNVDGVADLCEYHREVYQAGEPITLTLDGARGARIEKANTSPAAVGVEGANTSPAPDSASPAPPPPPSPEPGVVQEIASFDALPLHAGPESEEVTPPNASIDPLLADLEKMSRDRFGHVPENPDDADRLAAHETDPATVAKAMAGTWTPARVETLLRLTNPILVKDGKAPLTAAELKDGGEALAPVFQSIFGATHNPFAIAIVWLATTYGLRYLPEIVTALRATIARVTGRAGRAAVQLPPRDSEGSNVIDIGAY